MNRRKWFWAVAIAAATQFLNVVCAGADFSVTAEGNYVEQQNQISIDAAVTTQNPDFGFGGFDALLEVSEFGNPNTFDGLFTLLGKDGG